MPKGQHLPLRRKQKTGNYVVIVVPCHQQLIDPLSDGGTNLMVIFHLISTSPEEKIKQMEKKVNELIEESCVACGRGEMELVRLGYVC